jgi:hypothetical protein
MSKREGILLGGISYADPAKSTGTSGPSAKQADSNRHPLPSPPLLCVIVLLYLLAETRKLNREPILIPGCLSPAPFLCISFR